MPMAQGAIFDLDGTLIDTMSAWTQVAEEYLNGEGIEDCAEASTRTQNMSLAQMGEYFTKELGIPKTSQQVIDEVCGMMEERYRLSAPLKPGAAAFLERVQQRGIPMCVATATAKHLAEAALKRLGIADYFSFVLTCDEVGQGKDSPSIFLQSAKRLGTKPHQTLVFEDSLYAIQTAHAAGFVVVGMYERENEHEQQQIIPLCDQYYVDFHQALKEAYL